MPCAFVAQHGQQAVGLCGQEPGRDIEHGLEYTHGQCVDITSRIGELASRGHFGSKVPGRAARADGVTLAGSQFKVDQPHARAVANGIFELDVTVDEPGVVQGGHCMPQQQ
ncbi:hypothetical protein D3C80_1181620 [compost metagenome]